MDSQVRIIVLLGIVEVIILTMIGLYFFRFSGNEDPAGQVSVPDKAAEEPRKVETCARAGCSSQLCVDAKTADQIITTCEYREEYGCYRVASCEVQSDGKCGFTATPELAACLEKTSQTPKTLKPIR
jgi:hypothetical protein